MFEPDYLFSASLSFALNIHTADIKRSDKTNLRGQKIIRELNSNGHFFLQSKEKITVIS